MEDALTAAYGLQASSSLMRARPVLWVTSSFSGMGSVEHVLSRLGIMDDPACFQEPKDGIFGNVRFYAMWEMDKKCRQLVLASKIRPQHMFGDVTEKFSSDVVDRMEFCRTALIKRVEEECSRQGCTKAEAAAAKKRVAKGACRSF